MPAAADWRNPTAHNKMNQPFEWSNLDEAAEWLAGCTGKPWGPRDVLNAALRYPIGDNPAGASNRCTAIGVALPHGYSIQHAVLNVGEGRDYLEKLRLVTDANKNEPVIPIWPGSWRPVALLQTQVRQLLAAGWVEVATARQWDDMGGEVWKMDIVSPPFVAELENTGILRRCLVALAGRWKADNPAGPVDADQGAVDSETIEPPEKWARGIRRVAWDAAKAIVASSDKLTADGLEKAMLNSAKVELKNGEYQLKSTDASLTEREMRAKPKTIAGWVTDLKSC